MQISKRIKSILKAQVLSLLELEDQTTAEDIARKDIDHALGIVRGELGRTLARKHRLAKALPEAAAALQGISGKAELAISHNAESLARAAIARKMELETHLAQLQEDIETCERDARELETIARRLSIAAGQTGSEGEFKELERAFRKLDETIEANSKTKKEGF